ncbi:MAG: hypothetical protein WD357_05255 [Gracilimonas sp.]
MSEEKVVLKLKKSWKWFICLTQLTAISLLLYLMVSLWSVVGFSSPNGIFLTAVFGGGILGSIYFMLYALKHKVHFYRDELTKEGVFTGKTRKYNELNEVWLSTKLWDMKSPVAIIGDSENIVFDYRYANQKEVADFLTKNNSQSSLPKLFFNSKDLFIS